MKSNKHTVIAANIPKDPAFRVLCIVGKDIPITKLPPQFAILPSAMALDLGPTSNNSEPIKYGIGPKPSW